MRTIPLTQGKVALVDDADYEFLSRWKWHALKDRSRCYAKRCRCLADGPGPSTIPMHRIVLAAPRGLEVDHINGDALDNRRENLRLATAVLNGRNKHQMYRPANPGLPMGAQLHRKRFQARIRHDGHLLHLGTFDTPEEAHAAYLAARAESIESAKETGRGARPPAAGEGGAEC